MEGDKPGRKVVVVGAGLVGTLEACFLAKRGMEVHVFDRREDIRQMEHVPGRSINLAMSVRGLAAFNELQLDEHVKQNYGIPMYARMIHNKDGSTHPIPYGKGSQCIYSVGRRYINEILLDKGDTLPNITYHFNHKLVTADLEKPELTFQTTTDGKVESKVVKADLVVGCDGAYSAIRREMLKKMGFNYKQEYIPHSYMELCLPPTADDTFAMATNYLHIWPRGQFMMIGLPNQDKSFTLTLFMPTPTFETINDETSLLKFFEENFQDAIPLIGKDKLVADYMENKALPMISVKCSPYNVGSTALIMGDAAHAMVPFYGQGMNCGMEDCLVLNAMLDKHGNDLKRVLHEYTKFRNPDAEAMVDLAFYNYIEMRDLVNRKSFLLRKKLDNLLHWLMPASWVPLYTSVTFSRMRYHQCIANREWQDTVISRLLTVAGLTSVIGVLVSMKSLTDGETLNHWLHSTMDFISKYKYW